MTRSWSSNYTKFGPPALAVLVLALVGLAAPTAAADPVPMTITVTGVIPTSSREPGGITALDLSYQGNATHLGDYTATGLTLLDHHGDYTGHGCLVAANGTDSVCYDFMGGVQPTDDRCVFTLTHVWTVTGGTGSFADATGGGSATDGLYDECAGTFSATLTGTISRPNSG